MRATNSSAGVRSAQMIGDRQHPKALVRVDRKGVGSPRYDRMTESCHASVSCAWRTLLYWDSLGETQSTLLPTLRPSEGPVARNSFRPFSSFRNRCAQRGRCPFHCFLRRLDHLRHTHETVYQALAAFVLHWHTRFAELGRVCGSFIT